ncbi:MAG: hypothetical protein ABJN14_15085 [Paracoccaceae bacterium]
MNKLSDLATLMELKYQASQVELRSICVREAKIREQIARLDQQSISTLSAGASTMKSVGADMLWNAWAGRAKSDLNTELARVLARKEFFLRAARRNFGKVLASQSLSKEERNAVQISKKARDLDGILESLKLSGPGTDQ